MSTIKDSSNPPASLYTVEDSKRVVSYYKLLNVLIDWNYKEKVLEKEVTGSHSRGFNNGALFIINRLLDIVKDGTLDI